ncbi:unnamed protein product [Periconia digitata]|uniref:DUF7580 domain-containing protein n=1 Tax=Periconia digitata TaxID=1303443 RepID=A0A9W4UB21_9PLEO|nr:unnamed protein product [Periconia digitata]
MSGVEAAGLVFGVLPILVKVVQSYSTVSRTFHDFRHYSKEVRSIQVQFKVVRGIFMNECQLLLCLVEDEEGAKSMLEDHGDRRWTSKDLNDRFNDLLKTNLELFRSIIEASKESIDTVTEELQRFDVLVDMRNKGESIKSAIKRLRNATRIAFDKSKYEKSLTGLRSWNSELSQLREQISTFQQKRSSADNRKIRGSLPSHIGSIRTASQNLHQALSGAWCCTDLAHDGHCAKLYVEAEVETEVRLDLAISYGTDATQCSHARISEPPILFYVQTISMDTIDSHAATPTTAKKLCRGLAAGTNTDLLVTQSVKKKASSELSNDPIDKLKTKKRKKVHFDDCLENIQVSGSISYMSGSGAVQPSTPTIQQVNLCQMKNICNYLAQNLQLCSQSPTSQCIGYLDSPEMYRHMFYAQENKLFNHNTKKLNALPRGVSCLSIHQAMDQEVADDLTIVDQLKLAHKATLAILQYNSTPWLPSRWRLKDLSYFSTQEPFNEDSLKSLHLSSEISPSANANATVLMEGIEHSNEADNLAVSATDDEKYGINNATLFFLGVALLEISHWKRIEMHNVSKGADTNAILAARRLANRPTRLGSKYRDIARKCLQCNFGFGTDLERRELQEAVHRDVVCQLEQMIEMLSID